MSPMNLFFRRRPWGGAIALGLLIGGILVTGAGAILWGKNAVDRKAAVQSRWKQAEGIFDARTEKRAIEAMEGFNKERGENLGAVTAEGGQVAVSVQTSVVGPMGTVVDLMVTASEAKDAADEYQRLLGRAPANKAEACLLALQRKALEKSMKSKGLPLVGALKDQMLRDYLKAMAKYQKPGELARIRRASPSLYGNLDDVALLKILSSKDLESRMKQVSKSLDGLRQSLKKMGITPTAEVMERLIELRYTEGAEAFKKEVARMAEAAGPRYDGTFSGSFSGQATGSMSLTINGTHVTGQVRGKYGKDPVTGTCQGTIDKAGNLNLSLSGAFTKGKLTFGGTLKGRVSGQSASGTWYAANKWAEPVGSWTLHRQ